MRNESTGGARQMKNLVPPLKLKRQRSRFTDVIVAIILPWLVFFLVVSLFLFAYHQMKVVVWSLIGACLALSLLFFVLGFRSPNATFLAIGYLCVTSLIVGTVVGLSLDREYLQHYWELDNGTEYKDVDPTADAGSTKDASVIQFVPGTFVDDRRTVGFISEGRIFCTAPVSLPQRANAAVAYWAIGEGCCQMRSNFDCGTARDLDAYTAVAEKRNEVYSKAIEEAVSVYGINATLANVGLVAFVSDPQAYIGEIWDEALTVALIAMIMDLVMCAIAGFVLGKILTPPDVEQQPFLSQQQ